MTRADRWMVGGAWTALVVCAAVGFGKIARAPKVESWVVAVEERFRKESRERRLYFPTRARWRPEWNDVVAGGRPVPDFAASIVTELRVNFVARPILTVEVLPRAVAARVTKADLDGVAIGWELESPARNLPDHVKEKGSKPAAILVERSEGGGWKAVASLDPKATRHVDLTAEPNRAYRYRVVVVGPEVVLDEDQKGVRRVPEARSEPEDQAEAKTPPAHRVAVIGGDTRVAVLRIERYDREKKAWVPRVVNAKPGEKIGTSGWMLDGLRTAPGRFGSPVLVADVTDETGARRELRTTTSQE